MSKLKLAACGIDCEACGSYKATVFGDISAAEELVEWYRGCGWIPADAGAEEVLALSPLCRGCWEDNADCFFKCGCYNIDFRVCCKDRGIENCSGCDDFPCKNYADFANANSHHMAAMETIETIRNNSKTN